MRGSDRPDNSEALANNAENMAMADGENSKGGRLRKRRRGAKPPLFGSTTATGVFEHAFGLQGCPAVVSILPAVGQGGSRMRELCNVTSARVFLSAV